MRFVWVLLIGVASGCLPTFFLKMADSSGFQLGVSLCITTIVLSACNYITFVVRNDKRSN